MTHPRRKYDRAEIVRLYESGMMAGDIAAQLGCHRATIYTNLKAAGVEPRDDRGRLPGRGRKEFCGRGVHRMLNEDGTDTDNVFIDGGARACRRCAEFRWALRSALA